MKRNNYFLLSPIIKLFYLMKINILLYKIKKKYKKIIKIFTALQFYLFNSYLTNFPSHKLRLFYLRRILNIKIGINTSINMGCFFAGNNISFGNNTVLARECYLDGRTSNGFIEIGNNVSIAPNTFILSMTHVVNSAKFEAVSKKVVIDDFAWLGTRSLVLPGVHIGKGAVLGAASTATKSIPDFTISVGSPAKFIGKRNDELAYTLNYFPYFNSDIT
jgi:maltose O-acetyltransferase